MGDAGGNSQVTVKINHYSSQQDNSNAFPATSQSEENSSANEDDSSKKSKNFSSIVAAHYNSAQKTDVEKRNYSRIVYLRNFNNWIKSILIIDSVNILTDQNQRNLTVLDMCCGKGGDLFKWSKFNVRHMICVDIAENSLEEYKSRFNDFIQLCQRNKRYYTPQCEFITADCTRVRLRGVYQDPSIRFDIVSCQFSFHYCFESLPQAECMLKNASECLKPGGLFIGTIPNANEIVKKVKQSKTNSYKNEVFAVEMCCTEPYPLFGAKYNFYLEGVVNCPEFLVHFPTFEKLASKFGFKLVRRESFMNLFERRSRSPDGIMLLRKMKALETYPPEKDKKLVGLDEDYNHVRYYNELHNKNHFHRVGTLTQSEWEGLVVNLDTSGITVKKGDIIE